MERTGRTDDKMNNLDRRLSKVEELSDKLTDMAITMKGMLTTLENMQKEQSEQGERLRKIEEEPADAHGDGPKGSTADAHGDGLKGSTADAHSNGPKGSPADAHLVGEITLLEFGLLRKLYLLPVEGLHHAHALEYGHYASAPLFVESPHILSGAFELFGLKGSYPKVYGNYGESCESDVKIRGEDEDECEDRTHDHRKKAYEEVLDGP
jgi:hypothetical protein